MNQYNTLVEALNDLQKRGFTHNFNIEDECVACPELDLQLHPEQFEVVEFYRFEGMTDPADSSIVYAIESVGGIKGTLVNAYGTYADALSNELVAKLSIHR